MYKVSAEELNLFRKCYRQTILIKVFGIDGLTELTEADILENGLTVDRYCFSSGKLEIGSAVASELSVKLDNHLGKFDTVDFDGAVFSVSVGIKKWDAKQWENAALYHIPLGIFTVDDITKDESSITLNALDNMVKFDKPFDSDITFPTTLGDLLQKACTACGVLLHTTDFPNASYTVTECPEGDNLTWRQIVQWIAEIAGANALVDWNGHLRLTWFEDTDIEITSFDRYSSETEEYSVTVTGVQVVDTNDEKHLAGVTGCVLNIEGNKLIQHDADTLAERIYGIVEGFQYLPYSCTTRAFPFLFPMDTLVYVDKKGVRHKTIVSAVTYTVNGTMSLAGEGVGKTENERSPASGTTKQEKLILEKVKQSLEKDSATKYSTLMNLNQTIGGAFGLYQTEMVKDGVKTFYYHDKPALADSTVIYVFNSGGVAWTDDWNSGQPVWKYGFTKDGNAVYHILAAYKIQTDYLEAGCVTAEKISTSYKSSVEKAISDGDAAVTQAFTAADGQLQSLITAETTRAGQIEQQLSSSIQQNATAIALKASQSSVDNLTNRMTKAESSITQNATTISAKVSSTGGTASSFAWSLTSNGFTLTANDVEVLKVTKDTLKMVGDIESSNAVITGGSLTLGADGTNDYCEVTRQGIVLGGSTKARTTIGYSGLSLSISTYSANFGIFSTRIGNASAPPLNYIGMKVGMSSVSRFGICVGDSNRTYVDTGITIGTASGARFGQLFGTWKTNSGEVVTSDRNAKKNIEAPSEKYDAFFDKLAARRFKYKDGTSDRYHTGFIAQEVKAAMDEAQLPSSDFAALCVFNAETDDESWGLRYTEFISLNTWQIQKLKARVAELERMVKRNE